MTRRHFFSLCAVLPCMRPHKPRSAAALGQMLALNCSPIHMLAKKCALSAAAFEASVAKVSININTIDACGVSDFVRSKEFTDSVARQLHNNRFKGDG